MHAYLRILGIGVGSLLAGCASQTPHSTPTTARPQVARTTVESNGSLFHAGSAMMLFEDQTAHQVGDLLTIEIAESLLYSDKTKTSNSDTSSVAAKGPGVTGISGLLKTLLNLNTDASGSSSFDSKSEISKNSSITGTLAVTVVDVLPNGNLVIGGDKRTQFGGETITLRLTGVINRRDVRPGNVISSKKVADARLEQVGQGVVSDATTKGLMQQIFLSVLDVY